MKVKAGNKTYNVKFNHHEQKITIVTITDGEKVYTGLATVSEGDQFCKETGRRIALTRAVKELPRDERTIIWETYRNWGKKRF